MVKSMAGSTQRGLSKFSFFFCETCNRLYHLIGSPEDATPERLHTTPLNIKCTGTIHTCRLSTTRHNTARQVWNAHAEQKKVSTGDGYMTSCNRAALVPEAANVLREQGHPEMANILDNTTEGARKVK